MSAPDHHTREAIALQLIAALECYEDDVTVLCRDWLDMEQYQSVSQQVDDLRMVASGLPQLSVLWVTVLISHAELIHALWKGRRLQDGDTASIEQLLREHVEAVRSLHSAASRLRG
ncbi:MAG: hypothetical protein K0R58_2509 [Ramlibacter sp.]|jgi:hypothetical protein|nr:hypothetical protein [Ramlibacter sp.]